jgi:D-sedoheptulose 7-phosphate isomerase
LSERINRIFHEAIAAHTAAADRSSDAIERAAAVMRSALAAGGKILAFGNGGSATDAQHFAAELVNRFQVDRPALAAIALTTDGAILTSIANDTSYDRVFARQLEALARTGDVALGISTSGRSPSVLAAFETARGLNVRTIALLGERPVAADVAITVPSHSTARVQEVHRTILHALCELIEA